MKKYHFMTQLLEKEVFCLPEHVSSLPVFLWGSLCSMWVFLCIVMYIIVCPLSYGHCIVCPFIDSDYPFGIFKPFFENVEFYRKCPSRETRSFSIELALSESSSSSSVCWLLITKQVSSNRNVSPWYSWKIAYLALSKNKLIIQSKNKLQICFLNLKWILICSSTSSHQFFSYIMARKS